MAENLVFSKDTYPGVIEVANELAELEERKPHDSVSRLIIEAGKNKISELKRLKKTVAVLLFVLLSASQAFGTLLTLDADDFADYESMHEPIPEMLLWRSYDMQNPDERYDYKVFAVPSTDSLMGERSIGWMLSPASGYEEWWADYPCLYIEINGLASSITLDTANRPNWIRKTVIVDCYDMNGVQVAHNFTNIGRKNFVTDVGEYEIAAVVIWTTGQMAIDNIQIDHIPEPSTILILGLGGLIFYKSRQSVTPCRSEGMRRK